MQVFMDHPSRLYHRLQTRMGCPKVPLLKVRIGPSPSSITPEVSKTLLNGPGSGCLQLHLLENRKPLLMLLGKVFLRIQPKIFGSTQRVITSLLQGSMLFLTHLVHRLAHMSHQVVAIKYDFISSEGRCAFTDAIYGSQISINIA